MSPQNTGMRGAVVDWGNAPVNDWGYIENSEILLFQGFLCFGLDIWVAKHMGSYMAGLINLIQIFVNDSSN